MLFFNPGSLLVIGREGGDELLVASVFWVVTPLLSFLLSAGDDKVETIFWAPSNGLTVLGSITRAEDTSTFVAPKVADTPFGVLGVPDVVLLEVDFGFETFTLAFLVIDFESVGFECDVVESKGVACLAAVGTVETTVGSTAACLTSVDLCSENE